MSVWHFIKMTLFFAGLAFLGLLVIAGGIVFGIAAFLVSIFVACLPWLIVSVAVMAAAKFMAGT